MAKKMRKLVLKKESVKVLQDGSLRLVFGGDDPTGTAVSCITLPQCASNGAECEWIGP